MAKKSINLPFKNVNSFLDQFSSFEKLKSSKKVWLVILIAGLLLLAFYKKSWFVAAMVNGMPITNLELQMKLNEKQFRAQVLNQLIEKKIILDEARKNNAMPTGAEIDQRISELELQVGGSEALDAILSQQGLMRASLKDQLVIPLAVSKLYEKDATVSAEEISKFIETNSASLQATDSAQQQIEAANLLKQQKLTEIFNERFQKLRESAKIQIF